MNRMKQAVCGLLALLMGLSLCACGGGGSAAVDIKALPEALLEKIQFEDELAELDADAIENLYAVPQGVTARVFLGSGATAEEIAVFEAPDEATAKTMLENAKSHIADRITGFQDYLPEQVQTLNEAIVKQIGSCVVVCVTKDVKTAESIIG